MERLEIAACLGYKIVRSVDASGLGMSQETFCRTTRVKNQSDWPAAKQLVRHLRAAEWHNASVHLLLPCMPLEPRAGMKTNLLMASAALIQSCGGNIPIQVQHVNSRHTVLHPEGLTSKMMKPTTKQATVTNICPGG